MEAVWVDIVSRVVTPRATRAGTACGSSQKLTLQTKILLLVKFKQVASTLGNGLPTPSV